MREKPSDKWVSAGLSVLVHGTIVGLLVYGFWFYRSEPTPQPQVAIEASMVDPDSLPADVMKALPQTQPAPVPPPPAPVPEPEPEPAPEPEPEPPPPDDSAQREQERLQREEEQRAADARAEQQREKERAEQVREKQEAERVAREKAVQEKAAQEKAAQEKAARDKAEREKAEKDRQQKELAERQAQQKAAEERQRVQREAELRAQMAAEERVTAARSSTQMQQYLAQIRGRIERAWIRPPSARAGLSCEVRIQQVPGGEVVGVQVTSCNGDEAVRQSIEAAAYRASPLPAAPDAALFDRNLVVTFRPED